MINISHFRDEDVHEAEDHDDRLLRVEGAHIQYNNRMPTIFRQLADKEDELSLGLWSKIKRKQKE